jgi:hypothetical protein
MAPACGRIERIFGRNINHAAALHSVWSEHLPRCPARHENGHGANRALRAPYELWNFGAYQKGHHPMKFVHRGFEKLGKWFGDITVLLLVLVLIGSPFLAIIAFSISATAKVALIVGGGPSRPLSWAWLF